MTESEWLTSTDPAAMLGLGTETPCMIPVGASLIRVSDRKLRLFAVACCRQVWDGEKCEFCGGKGRFETSNSMARCPRCTGPDGVGTGRVGGLTDPRSRRAVEVAERYADGDATEEEVSSAIGDAFRAAYEQDNGHPSVLAHDCLAVGDSVLDWSVRACVADGTQADLLRCVVGNPWQPWARSVVNWDRNEKRYYWQVGKQVSIGEWNDLLKSGRLLKADWLTPNVLTLARSAYESRCDGPTMLALADALEEAGATSADLLEHLREPLHAGRGCWVLDLLLGKE